jgi:hypothetical protein
MAEYEGTGKKIEILEDYVEKTYLLHSIPD